MSQERTTYPPLVAHGPDNNGAVVVVVSFVFMFVTVLFAVLRALSSQMQKRELKWDDISFLLAVVLIIPETALTERAVYEGLGQHINTITDTKLASYYKYIYVTQLLGIIIQTLAKFSVLLMIERITVETSIRKAYLLKIAIGVWGVFSFFVIAFQCGIPQPWEFTRAKCAAQGKLHYVIIAGDMVTDGVLACYFIPTIWRLHMHRRLRALISFLFGLRLVVCAVMIPYLALLPKYLSSDDKTWYNANVQIFHQVVVNLSVIAASILSVRRFMTDLQSGKFGVFLNDREIEMTTSQSKSRTANNSENLRSQKSGLFVSRRRSTRDHKVESHTRSNGSAMTDSQDLKLRPDMMARYTTHVVGGVSSDHDTQRDAREKNVRDEEVSDDKSTSSLRKNAVYQQRDFDIYIEDDSHRSDS